MTTTTPATELDFDKLKAEIITYISADPTFTDYNFDGSALNALINVLVKNTHVNAYYASMLNNESFLDTAQKRSSITSHAKRRMFVPRSVVGSRASIDITVNNITNGDSAYVLRGDTFSSKNENGAQTFVVLEDVISKTTSTAQTLTGITLVQGTLTTNRFIVDVASNPKQFYTIPNANIDVSTLIVEIKESASATEYTRYTKSEDLFDYIDNEFVYYLQESYDGKYQIFFGNDIIGPKVVDGNIIDISYIVSSGNTLSNSCLTFQYDSTFGGNTTHSITTTQTSFGGAAKQSIDDLRESVSYSNVTQNRAVSALDYVHLLSGKFNYIKSVSAWGGEGTTPPQYGKVFISIQPTSGLYLSDSIKTNNILPILKKYSVAGIVPVLVDPKYINVEFIVDVRISLSKFKNSNSFASIENAIKTSIVNYIERISRFGTEFVETALLQTLLTTSNSIVSIYLNKRLGVDVYCVTGRTSLITEVFGTEISPGSFSSTKFKTNFAGTQNIVSMKEISDTDFVKTSNTQKIYCSRIGTYNSDKELVSDIGYIEYTTGKVVLEVYVDEYLTDNRFIGLRISTPKKDFTLSDENILFLNQTISEDKVIGLNVPVTINISG